MKVLSNDWHQCLINVFLYASVSKKIWCIVRASTCDEYSKCGILWVPAEEQYVLELYYFSLVKEGAQIKFVEECSQHLCNQIVGVHFYCLYYMKVLSNDWHQCLLNVFLYASVSKKIWCIVRASTCDEYSKCGILWVPAEEQYVLELYYFSLVKEGAQIKFVEECSQHLCNQIVGVHF